MIEIKLMLFILLIHFLADFALQTHWQASNKSTSFKALNQHVFSYSLIWLIASYIWFENSLACLFWLITYTAHLATDFFSALAAKRFFDQKDYHNGFVIVGIDQVAHYIQLIFTFKLIESLL
jgi:general stress protein CsbA